MELYSRTAAHVGGEQIMYDVPVAIMKVGVTPSNFDPKYNGLVKSTNRYSMGFSDKEDPMVLVVCRNPHLPDTEEYSVFGMTLDELKIIRDKGTLATARKNYVFQYFFDANYKESNEGFFKELEASDAAQDS